MMILMITNFIYHFSVGMLLLPKVKSKAFHKYYLISSAIFVILLGLTTSKGLVTLTFDEDFATDVTILLVADFIILTITFLVNGIILNRVIRKETGELAKVMKELYKKDSGE